MNSVAIKSLEDFAHSMRPPPAKRQKLPTRKKAVNPDTDPNQEEAYNFVCYAPFRGKVWELYGLKSVPIEVGEVPSPPSPPGFTMAVHRSWMDVVRSGLRMKMRKYGGGDDGGGSIRFTLLAIVKEQMCQFSDKLELLKRERIAPDRQPHNTYLKG